MYVCVNNRMNQNIYFKWFHSSSPDRKTISLNLLVCGWWWAERCPAFSNLSMKKPRSCHSVEQIKIQKYLTQLEILYFFAVIAKRNKECALQINWYMYIVYMTNVYNVYMINCIHLMNSIVIFSFELSVLYNNINIWSIWKNTRISSRNS